MLAISLCIFHQLIRIITSNYKNSVGQCDSGVGVCGSGVGVGGSGVGVGGCVGLCGPV